MHIKLCLPELLNARLMERVYDPDLDDIRSILIDVCRSVEKQGQFVISGFGQDPWPVDMGTDLVIFLEQLPGILHAIISGLPAELNFYEQGVERTITFSPCGNDYVVSCVSQGAWQPNPNVEQVDRVSLEQMLLGVQEEFMNLVRMIAPSLSKHPWVQSWLEGTSMH